MGIETAEIELTGDEEDNGSHGIDAGVAAGFAFCRLKQSVECFEKPTGLPSLRPCHDAIQMVADHFGHRLHRFNFGSHNIGTPLCQQGRDDVDLFALEDFPQLFTVGPKHGQYAWS